MCNIIGVSRYALLSFGFSPLPRSGLIEYGHTQLLPPSCLMPHTACSAPLVSPAAQQTWPSGPLRWALFASLEGLALAPLQQCPLDPHMPA